MEERVREWAHSLGRIPLVLGLGRDPGLGKTFSSRQVVFVVSLLYGLIYSNIAWMA